MVLTPILTFKNVFLFPASAAVLIFIRDAKRFVSFMRNIWLLGGDLYLKRQLTLYVVIALPTSLMAYVLLTQKSWRIPREFMKLRIGPRPII